MPSTVREAVDTYICAVSERDPVARAKLIEACFAEDGRMVARSREVRGRAALDEEIARLLADQQFVRVRILSEIDAQGTTFRFRSAVDRRDGQSHEFFDAGQVDANGRISLILVFSGPLADS